MKYFFLLHSFTGPREHNYKSFTYENFIYAGNDGDVFLICETNESDAQDLLHSFAVILSFLKIYSLTFSIIPSLILHVNLAATDTLLQDYTCESSQYALT
jgi:hypothetical protein